MSLFFSFSSFVASNSATSNFASLDFASFSLLRFNSPTLHNLVGFDLRSFNSVGSNLVGFNLATSEFDNKLPFFYDTPPACLTSRFFLLGPPGSLSIPGYNFNLHVRLSLLLSYFKPHFNSCQVCFADNLPNFRRNLSLSNLAMSAFSNSNLHHYISFVPSLQLHYSLESNYLIFNSLQSSCLRLDSFGSTYLPSISLPDQVTIPSNLPSLSSQDLNSNGGIFFQFSLPKLRLSSRSFALYLSKPSSLVPTLSDSHPLEPFDFNRSFYSQNLPSFVGLLGSFIHSSNSSIGNSISPVHHSIDNSVNSIGNLSSNNSDVSTCELSSLHHFLNLRSRTASFFSFLDSFFLIDSPFLDSLPWDSFSLQQNPFCFPSLPSHLHTSSADFSLFDKQLFLANNSFFLFAHQQSCLQSCLQSCYEEHFSLQQDLFHPFNHNCSSYKQHFPLNQELFLLGEEQFLANNCIFTSNISFPSTSFLQLQPYPTFLASSFQASTFKSNFNANFNASFIPNLKTSFPAFLNLHHFFDNFACSANFPHFHNFDNFFTFSHSIQLDIYHHLDKINPCPSASLHFSQFNNSSLLSHYFSNLSNLVTQNHLTLNNYFCNSANLAIQNHLTFSDYFSNSSYLMMQNQLFSSNHFYNSYNLMLLNCVIFNYYFYNYSSNFVHLLTSNPLTLQHYSNYFVDFVPPNCVTLQHYACNFIDFVHTNNFIFNYYFYNLPFLVTHNNVILNNYFSTLRYLVTHNNVILNNYFSTLSLSKLHNNIFLSNYFSTLSSLAIYNSIIFNYYFCNLLNFSFSNNSFLSTYFHNLRYLMTHNNIFLSNFFCNLTFSKLHNNVFLNNYFCNLSSFSSCNNVFLSNLFCNFTYFTSLKSCSNEANLHNRPSYLNDLLAKYSVYSLHSPSFKTLLRNHTRSFYSSTLTKTSNNLSKKASSMRSHYRIKISFEGKVPSHFAISLARNYLSKQFPNAILLASCHQNTDHTHIHVLLFARDLNGKKLHFSNSNYKKLDIGWAKIYSRVFGEHKFQQHIDKKALSRSWKKDRLMGFDRQKPYRVSITNRQQQQLQPQFQQHNQQQQHHNQHHNQHQHPLNAPINHYKHLQLAHNFNHILPFKHLQLVHNVDHKQLYNQLSSNHFGTNIELNQPYNKLYNKTFDLNIVQNSRLLCAFDNHFDKYSQSFNALHNHFDSNIKHFHNHFDKYLDFNSCRFYGLSLNDGVHFNTFDSIFVTKDPFFLAQDRAFHRPFDRTYDTVFIDKQPFLADKHIDKLLFIDNKFDKQSSVVGNSIDKTASVVGNSIDKQPFLADKLHPIFVNSIDKHLSVADKNVTHFYNNPVPSALSMNNNSSVDKDLASHRPSTNLPHLHLNQQNLIHQLQHQQQHQQNFNQNNQLQHQNHLHNFNQNLSQQHNLELQPTNLNQLPLPQDLHQLQHNPLYNQTHLNLPINLTPLSSHTYLDLIHTLDNVYIDRVNDRVINEREINEKVISDRELNEKVLDDRELNEKVLDDRELNEKVLDDRVLNERALDDTINDRDSLSRNDSNVLHKHSLATTDHNLHPIQDNGLDRNHDYDYELDLDEPSR